MSDGWEKVFDVALSDGREADPKTGLIPPVGNTVDVANATYSNDIGDSQLTAVWTDPEFDPSQHAVYYVRVIEIPTPRSNLTTPSPLNLSPAITARRRHPTHTCRHCVKAQHVGFGGQVRLGS